jgi:aryl-alcohol dehydrogenase-like predicted oxidoreductase
VQTRKLGANGPPVSKVGFGCYELTGLFGTIAEKDAIAVLLHALDLGITLLDTADIYGPYINEKLIGRTIKGRREQVFLLTKFGQEIGGRLTNENAKSPMPPRINGRPDYVRKACDASLKRLGVDHIDMYVQHRVDPTVPIEETVGAMGELVEQGKVRYIGLSEPAVATVRRAHKTYPLTAIESEYSLWTREPENEMFDVVDELRIGFIAFSPLGRGFLTSTLKQLADLPPDDLRRSYPRFTEENFNKNRALLAPLEEIARELDVSAAQVSLAWVLHQREFIVPIPGTKRQRYLDQNAAAAEISLSPEILARLNRAMPVGIAAGPRHGDVEMQRMNR